MRITRRGYLGLTVAAAGMAAVQTASANASDSATTQESAAAPRGQFVIRNAGSGGHDYTDALAALRAYAIAEMDAQGLPGMTLSVTDIDGFVAVLALGWADVERRVPLVSENFFQIGSISKSTVALTILALADQGRIDLDAPVAKYLPDAALPDAPITVAQLLSHSTGLPDGALLFPRVPDGKLWSGSPPGSHFSYSNTGFNLLGALIERITGMSHQDATRKLVREPLGLGEMAGTIREEDRARYAVGYWAYDETASTLPHAPLEVAPWNEEDVAAGSIGATSEVMAKYLRALMRIGRGQGAPVLSDAAAHRFATPVIKTDDFGPDGRYACGIAVVPLDGKICFHHTGGMISFTSSFHADAAEGVGCFASVNATIGNYRPRQTTAFAVRLLRAARSGARAPSAPDPLTAFQVKKPAPYLGRFVSQQGDVFTLVESAEGLRIGAFGTSGRVAPSGDSLMTDHPKLTTHLLDPVLEKKNVVGFWWGETLFGRNTPRAQPVPTAAARALSGVYLNRDPWVGYATVLARGDKIVAEGLGQLVERNGYWTLAKDAGGVERFRFDAVLNGRPQRLNASGVDLWRVTV